MSRRLYCVMLSIPLAALIARAAPGGEDYVRIARLSYVMGNVSFQHGTDVDWSAASINLPLQPQDRIYAGPDGRAEIEFDDGSVFRVSESTDVEILSLRENLIQLRVIVGLCTLNVASGLDFEINTPAAAFSARTRGVYRFRVEEDGSTEAVVRKGAMEAANNGFSGRIEPGERLRFGPGENSAGTLARYLRRDEWDEWNDRRDADRRAYNSRRYLPESVYVGVSELDRYGRWVHVDNYGMAWVPLSVGVYWSPYSIGRWCYRPLFGWTWISYEPWGWLPYHYGRWHRSAVFGWCWLPGPGFAFNFWSPALVSFYSGPGWISWCPLGPGDYYNINRYYYNRGIHYYQLSRLRELHARAPGDLFNRGVRGAFQTVHTEHFRNESFVGGRDRSGRPVNVAQPWKEGSLVKDRLEIQPGPASFKPAPERAAVRPRMTDPLPAVVRNHPEAASASNRGYAKITNPQILSAPLREQRSSKAESAPGVRNNRNSSVREVQFPGVERPAQDSIGRNQIIPESQAPRRVAVPRGSDGRDGGGETPQMRWRSTTVAPAANTAPSRNSSGGLREPAAPAINQPQAPPAAVTAPAEGRPQSGYGRARADSENSWGNREARIAGTPEIRRSTADNAERQAESFSSRPQGGAGRSVGAPKAGRDAANSAPPAARSTGIRAQRAEDAGKRGNGR